MRRLTAIWKWISDIGVIDIPEQEKRSLNILNRINFFVIIGSFLGFVVIFLNFWTIHGTKPGIGSFRLVLMLISGLISFFLGALHHYYAAKIITSVIPIFLLIMLPTLLGDIRIEYYFYYPYAGTASALIPIILFPQKKERPTLIMLVLFCFLLSVTSDNFLTWFSDSEEIPDVFRERYFFYKLSQVLLFAFVVLTVFTLNDINTKYEKILAEQNSILIAQKEELRVQSENLLNVNNELQVLNQDLGNYKNHLEELVESRTSAFRESESRFRSLFENANDAIFILKKDVFFDCNLKTAEMFGCTKEQLLDSTPYQFSPPKQPDGTDSQMNAIEKINASLKGQSQRFEWQHIKLNGSPFDAEVSLNRIELKNQWFLLAIVHDITDRKKIENALRESERKFRNIFDNSKHPIIIIGLDARILAANRAFFELSGYQLEENTPLYATDIVLKNQRDQIRELLALLIREGNIAPQDFKVKLKNGQIRIIEANASMIEYEGKDTFLVIIRDVTDIKEAEQKLMEAIINTEENERSRIAQDLHDGLGPVLSTIKLYFQVYQDTMDKSEKNVLVEKIKSTIEEAIKGISEISHNISPHVFKNYGFYAALKQFVHQIALTKIVNIHLNCSQEPELNQNTGIILYRAITELINNSIKHSGCKNIAITFDQIEEFIQIDYSDDGKGFDVTSVIAGSSRGSGVQNIRNRLNALKGSIDITCNEGSGMHALLKVPA